MSRRKKQNRIQTKQSRAVDGFKGERTLSRRRHQDGNLIELKHGWSVRLYEDYHDNKGKRQRRRVHKFLGDFQKLPTRRAAQNAMQEELVLVNNSTARPRSTLTFREAAKLWITDCEKRTRRPVKPSVIVNWESILRNHVLPVLGELTLSEVGNLAMKGLVKVLVKKKLSPMSVKNITQTIKLVKASAVDENGDELYPTKWNHAFIDMPVVDGTKQRRPAFTSEQVDKIVRAATGRLQMAAILLAATGIRSGELLGLEVHHFDGTSVRIEQSLWKGKVGEPKTPNARRSVDLHPDVASLLQQFIGSRTKGFVFHTKNGYPMNQRNLARALYIALDRLEIPRCGFHAFRRYRNTFLRNSLCPDGLLKFWMGHAAKDMSDRYDRVREDVQFRRDVAKSFGVGFELPKALTAMHPKAEKKVQSGVIGRYEKTAVAVSC